MPRLSTPAGRVAPSDATRARPGRRVRPAVAGLAAMGLVVFLGASAWSDHRATARADAELAAAHTATVALVGQLDATQAQFRARVDQAGAAGRSLAADATLLSQDQQHLAGDQAALYAAGVNIAELGTCLNGAQEAVNQLSLGYTAGAGASVKSSAVSCAAAEADGA